jgi:hypothetical protein
MKYFDGIMIESTETDFSIVVDESEDGVVTLPCEDEEDALAMKHMFGGRIITRKVFMGVWHEFQTGSEVEAL